MRSIKEKGRRLAPVHPGQVLSEDFMKPFSLSAYRVAKDLGMSATQVSEIINGKRAVTAKSALLFAKYFGTSPEFWIRLQGQYDLEQAEPQLREQIAELVTLQT
jgi:addiction module HigA family antidote